MEDSKLSPIPIPWPQRWRDARLRFVPVVVFGAACFFLAILWRDQIAAPTLIGQAEPVTTDVSSYRPGLLAELTVSRFQKVKAGDLVGQITVSDPRILASTLAVIQSEIEMLRAEMKPITDQQRTVMDYDQLRLTWMKERAQLAGAKVELRLAETEFHRMEELFRDKIVSQRVFEQAKATQERLQKEVEELQRNIAEGEQGFKSLKLADSNDASRISETPLRAAIAVQEAKLRQTEAELSPVLLRAPMDGVITAIYRRAGEAVTAGQAIASIATPNPVRIVGYLRPPIINEPRAGMAVKVRTRGLHREEGVARIIEVGAQLETLPLALQSPVKAAVADLGLALDITLPANLNIRPGELVDITIAPQAN